VKRVPLAIVLGLFAPVVAFMGAALVEVPGQNRVCESLVGGLAVAVSLAICQPMVAPRGSRGLRRSWPAMAALGGPAVVMALVVAFGEDWRVWVNFSGPILLSIVLGPLAAATLERRPGLSEVSRRSCFRAVRASAALQAAAAIVLVAAVIPLARKAGPFPDGTPGAALEVFVVVAALNLLVALGLAVAAVRVGSGHDPGLVTTGAAAVHAGHSGLLAPIPLGFLALLVFLETCLLVAPAVAWRGHRPAMTIVCLLLSLGAGAELTASALLGAMAARLPDGDPSETPGVASTAALET
jgi:hypothetical protein